MPGRPLTAFATLAVLVCCATVGLEAVGVLFQPGGSDSELRSDAFLPLLDIDLDSQVEPSEPVDLPSEEAALPPTWVDLPAAAEPAEAEAAGTADAAPGPVHDKNVVVAFTMKLPQTLPPGSLPTEEHEDSEPPVEASPSDAGLPAEPPAVQEPEPVVVQPAAQTVEPAPPQPQRTAAYARSRSARASRARAQSLGCPLLGWMSL